MLTWNKPFSWLATHLAFFIGINAQVRLDVSGTQMTTQQETAQGYTFGHSVESYEATFLEMTPTKLPKI